MLKGTLAHQKSSHLEAAFDTLQKLKAGAQFPRLRSFIFAFTFRVECFILTFLNSG